MTARPSSGQEGAAAVAPSPTTPEDAERLLDVATSPAQAWAIYEISDGLEGDWRVVKLKAERRYGELLPSKKPGRRTSNTLLEVGGDAMAASRARKVASVPDEKFDAYLDSTPTPTRAGLLKFAGVTPKPRPRSTNGTVLDGLWQDENVLAWVRKRIKARRSRDEIVNEAKNGLHAWPAQDRHLPQNAADQCIAILKDRDRREQNHHPSGAQARLRSISSLRKERPGKLWDLRYQLMKLVGWLSQLDLLAWGIDEGDRDLVSDLYDDLVMLDEWTTRALARASQYIDDDGIREKIRKMKENQTGRTDAEKANITRRVAALERRLESKLSA